MTSQGQISVPAEVRKRFGIRPGSLLEFDDEEGKLVLRRKGTYTFEDMHKVLFPNGPPKRISVKQIKEVIGRSRAEKDARVMREWEEARREGR